MIAIDLGSNTIRFIEFDGVHWGKSFESVVRTAEGIRQSGKISDAALDRIVKAIETAKTELDFDHNEIFGCTTAAMRLSSNQQEALAEISNRTGVNFTVIDAGREADLTLAAVKNRLEVLALPHERFVLVDIGGGSTEFIAVTENAHRSISIDLGIVTLSESTATLADMQNELETFKQTANEFLGEGNHGTLVLTAGTPTTIAAYLAGMDYETYDPERINGAHLSLDDCRRVYDELLGMDEAQRTRYVGVGREQLIIAGILMVCVVYEALNTHDAIVVDDGLREGIALEFYRPR